MLKCYSCDNSVDARLCAINPLIYAKQILCRKGELCSVERQELPGKKFTKTIIVIRKCVIVYFSVLLAGVGFTKRILYGGVKTYETKTTESTSAPNK